MAYATEITNEQPIGVFDSGMGGLSVLRALEQRLPNENYIYFGDTARAPYGGRSREEIRRFNLEIGGWLLEQGCKLLLVACNTSTVLGMNALKASTAIPVFGMMEATLAGTLRGDAPADEVWPVGFIATQGTVESGAYQKAFAAMAPEKPFHALACPDFVPLVEQGLMDGPAVEQAIRRYLAPLREQGIRTLVLGCTHYPFLASSISAYFDSRVRLVDPAHTLASIVDAYLTEHEMLNAGSGSRRYGRTFYCSGNEETFGSVGGVLLGHTIKGIRRQRF